LLADSRAETKPSDAVGTLIQGIADSIFGNMDKSKSGDR
jgi:hypothetical protein